ncbi:MAG: TetR/AcrR family transcriptional regulator [Candidatus Aminicenantes bacterium]|jgi:AcrR family transcriptional regulator
MGIKERRKREKEQRRNDIIDAAEKVFFSKGYDLATMDDVADEAELSKGTLYLYFKNKEDLYMGITQRGLEILQHKFIKAVESHTRGIEQIRAIGDAYCEFAKKHSNYFRSMTYFHSHILENVADASFSESEAQEGIKVLQICAQALSQGIADGSIRPDINPMKVAIILWGQTTGILQLAMGLGKHMAGKFEQFHFADVDDIISTSFQLIRFALESEKKGGRT